MPLRLVSQRILLNLCVAYITANGGDGRLLVAAMLGTFGGVYLFYRGFQILERKRLIENTPTSKIRGAALGLIEVSGLAAGPYTLKAPITGVPCYYYRTIAWQMKRTGKNEHWEKVADESLHVPFYVNDNTGTLLVDPQGAEMDIHRDYCELYSNSIFSGNIGVPGAVAGFLGRHAIDCDKKTKVEEFSIKPKNSLFILGTLSQNHGVAVSGTPVRTLVTTPPRASSGAPVLSFQPVFSPTRETGNGAVEGAGPSEVVRLHGDPGAGGSSGMTQQGKVASALLRAGITNPTAWAAAGVMDISANPFSPSTSSVVSGSGAAVRTAPEPFDLHPATVLMQGARDTTFYISWRSQRDVVKSLGWKSALMIWGGPAVTLLSLYVLSSFFDGF